jgi:hypothetical protein
VRVYPDQKICVLDEEMARKYRLKDWILFLRSLFFAY